jgi:putative endonuclease
VEKKVVRSADLQVGPTVARIGRVTDQRPAFGKRGEDAACDELTKRGYRILERRFRTRCGEIDIVARDGDVIVFVEVKARSSGRFGQPFESLTWHKRQRLAQMAASYLFLKHLCGVPCRFDVVGVRASESDACSVEVLQNAFDLSF